MVTIGQYTARICYRGMYAGSLTFRASSLGAAVGIAKAWAWAGAWPEREEIDVEIYAEEDDDLALHIETITVGEDE